MMVPLRSQANALLVSASALASCQQLNDALRAWDRMGPHRAQLQLMNHQLVVLRTNPWHGTVNATTHDATVIGLQDGKRVR